MSYAPPYGDPYARPPSDRPPYDPYGRPPADPYGRPPSDPYARPPSERPYEQPPYDGGRPAYDRSPYSAPPPLARPPPGPPPPLPQGWVQEWEPSARRAFWVEQSTGRAQWEQPPYQPAYAGYDDGSRSVPPPGPPQGGYYAPPAGPPPVPYDNRPDYYQSQEPAPEKKSSNAGKYLAAGAAGLAVGGLAGAFIEHERDEDSEKSDLEEAYEDGRRDEAYEDDGGGFFD
ncbi:unnamed protein product [Penicillium olsonii]|uniref:WW domain-containing protein n=1 Tax=Penicillium olsonii TaxID=99116 RepID=A0A9W4MPW8_PENOL|nr:unnamed protein product [Penicillium olsonii]CAG7929946.1 unnamed protein product [Penicillium olsonii]CAG7964040.1 unnamed protein product [Penicillium olsonii]CAG8003327.1 unnamed protein product [Penicillium olsonii]CAG8039567.1 unnamed protein product [Penicillium olsonii]